MDRKKTKEKLKVALENVPNYVRRIQQELSEKKQINWSIGKISQCLNPEKEDWDNEIIEAALEMVSAEKEFEANLHQKVKSI